MKFSFRQILASTAGAVIAAVIASSFGVKGTIVGVAIGSAAATMATAFVAQSIDRGHEAVKQAAINAPGPATLLRKLGGTGATGDTHGSDASAPTEVMGRTSAAGDAGAETAEMASTAAPAGATGRLEISAAADAPATERLQATTRPMRAAVGWPAAARRFSWRAIAASAVIVFVLALLLITAVELISGKPLTAIFGGADTGTSVKNLFTPPPAPTTTPTSTTTTTSTSPPSSSSTTTTAATTTTSTTAPTGQTTTTTSPAPASSTTTAGVGATSTTTVSSVP